MIDYVKIIPRLYALSPNELDDFCFRQGVSALESFANHLLKIVSDLKK